MNKPLVSIIMPAFNADEYIEQAINSVIRQTYNNWELIIINDGSTDDTMNIALRYTSADARIKLINQENKKLGAARNTGIANSAGNWIAFLDADDLWVKDKLERQIVAAENEPNAGVIFSDGYIFTDRTADAKPYNTVIGFYKAEEIYKLEYQGNYIPVLSVLVKKKHLDEIGPQDETPFIYGCEDWDYWLRLAMHGVSFFGMEDKLFYYRRHTSNMSNDSNLMSLAKASVFIKNFKKDRFTYTEISKINSFVNLTICNFLRIGKTKEALFLNDKMAGVSANGSRKISNSLIRIFKRRSYYMVRAIYKLSSLSKPIKIAG